MNGSILPVILNTGEGNIDVNMHVPRFGVPGLGNLV